MAYEIKCVCSAYLCCVAEPIVVLRVCVCICVLCVCMCVCMCVGVLCECVRVCEIREVREGYVSNAKYEWDMNECWTDQCMCSVCE